MLVVAKSVEGREFMYKASSAHQVPKRSAEKIRDALNEVKYGLNENEDYPLVWCLHDVGPYDNAYAFAEYQSFGIRKGNIYERR